VIARISGESLYTIFAAELCKDICLVQVALQSFPGKENIMVSNAKTGKGHTFSVIIDGIELSDEQQDQLRVAVQSAAAQAMAGLDFKGDRAALALPLGTELGGRTQGIRFVGVSPEDVERLLPREQGL
jgi:hypothetical protein